MRIILIFLLLASFASCSKKKPPQAPLAFPVKVATAAKKDVPLFVDGLGHIESITSIEIRSRIEGELTGIFFEQGQEVKEGDLLFTIDPKPYEAALKSAQGALNQTLADLALSKEKLTRYKILARDEYYSQIDYETLQANYAANQGQVEKNQGEVDKALINLDYCWIYAPINGLTGILNIDYGNLVSADGQKPLITLNQIDPIFITFSLPEFQLHKIQKARSKYSTPLKIQAAYEKFDDEIFEGELFMIDNAVDPKTGMIKFRGVFQNSNRLLWPNQFIRVRLELETIKDAVVIPYSAIQKTANGAIAFVINQFGLVEQKNLKIGERIDDKIVILEGLQEGDQVVLEGQMNLYNGAKVIVKASS